MKTITEIKTEKENKVTELIKATSMFFAFSNKQFEENKTPLAAGEKYVSIGAGAYIPKSKVDDYLAGGEDIEKWFKAAIKSNKAHKKHIEYELSNHEAYYTNDIDDTLSALGDDYTYSEVLAVFKDIKRKNIND